jgi:hypothetical protein
VKVKLHAFLTSAVDGVQCHQNVLAALLNEERGDLGSHVIECCVVLSVGLDAVAERPILAQFKFVGVRKEMAFC